jgi:hypothetical protein
MTADFLNTEQRADIPGKNAQGFLSLSESICSDSRTLRRLPME